jgi:beta-barrel assembly-enhancing protease
MHPVYLQSENKSMALKKLRQSFFTTFISLLWLSNSFAGLPDLGSPSRQHLSTQQEKKMGQSALIEMTRNSELITDPILLDFLHQILHQLLSANQIPDKAFHIFLFQNSSINAFAGPNGILGLNSGTILAARTAGEVASVLAHEIAHVEQKHIARSVTTLGLLAAGIALGGQVGEGIATASIAGMTQHAVNFTRSNEEEADRMGMLILYNAGFSPTDMPNFFSQLQQDARFNAQPPVFLTTHPLTETRLADSLNRAAAYKSVPSKPWPYFDFIQMRLRAYTANNPYQLIDDNQKNKSPAAQYGLALAFLRLAQNNKADNLLENLLSASPNNPILIYSKAELDLEQQKETQALALLDKTKLLFNAYPALQYLYGIALEAVGRYLEACTILKKLLPIYPGDPGLYLELAQISGKAKLLAQAYYYRAHALLILGDPQTADHLLTLALAQKPLPSTIRSRIYFLRDQILKVKKQ